MIHSEILKSFAKDMWKKKIEEGSFFRISFYKFISRAFQQNISLCLIPPHFPLNFSLPIQICKKFNKIGWIGRILRLQMANFCWNPTYKKGPKCISYSAFILRYLKDYGISELFKNVKSRFSGSRLVHFIEKSIFFSFFAKNYLLIH